LKNPKSIYCNNPSPFARLGEPVRLGVPFARSSVNDATLLTLHNSSGEILPLQTLPLARWNDGSIKWLLCDFLADLPSSGEAVFTLQHENSSLGANNPFCIEKKTGCWQIDTGKALFEIDAQILRPFLSVHSAGTAVAEAAEMRLADVDGQAWTPKIDRMVLEAGGPVRATLFFSGRFQSGKRELLRFEARLHLFAGSARAAFKLRLHNARAALHPGNLWDLGDPGSVMLREWNLDLSAKPRHNPKLRLRTNPEEAWWEPSSATSARLYQESSGGQCWDSPVHRNRHGHVPMAFRGWRLSSGGRIMADGLRAEPLLWYGGAECQGISVSVDNFWQRFPKAAELSPQRLSISLLPPEFPGGHELQGGEQITETLRFDFAAPAECHPWGYPTLDARCDPEVYSASGVFPDGLWPPSEPRYVALTNTALGENTGFFAKREKIDEYGWRNFGELYADHESALNKDGRSFVSHYNNQYDPLLSFYRLYLAGCDARWGELARNLAAHLADIDINHTDEDREEYCHGPFWHTDHYLDAGLSTHRMASREHLAHKNPALCGGGPGAEHCYSSGLTVHYFLTGDPRSRELVLGLADWCWRSLNGPQTLGAAALRTIKRFGQWRRLQGTDTIWALFPFTRGTGNCLNATLDALEITNDRLFLSRAAELIKGTVHPQDLPQRRDLLNAEACWSYTVFLSALCRFLHIKHEWAELDNDYYYARESLLTYARWMAENEYPYLEKPEILEYPNETWAGQDLRKGLIFFHAAKYADEKTQLQFNGRARFFLETGFDELLQCDTHHFTRPLALTLQNGWVIEAMGSLQTTLSEFDSVAVSNGLPVPRVTFAEVIRRSAIDLLRVLPQSGPMREWRWLRARLGID